MTIPDNSNKRPASDPAGAAVAAAADNSKRPPAGLVATGTGPLARVSARRARIGLVAGGLGAYWPQFPGLLPQLERSARVVSERISAIEVGGAAPELTDVGFISDAQEGAKAAET